MEEKLKPTMNREEMQDYWNTLCSFTGEDVKDEIQKLVAKIRYPRYLCKYRAVNNNNLDALRSNKLFFSKASSYDDPFDTFLHIDVERLHEEFNSNYTSDKALKALADMMKAMLQNGLPLSEELKPLVTSVEGLKRLFSAGITNLFLSYVLSLRSKIQDEILSICFSENAFNESLWLKYADMYRGFCLEYDLQDPNTIHCGKFDKCVNCGVHKFGAWLYPVYYSNTPYDATDFVKFLLKQELIKQMKEPLPEFLNDQLEFFPWEIERNCLIKKECHRYDEEWRLIANCKMNLPANVEWVPSRVIIGLRTSNVDKNLIISMAKEAGIKRIYQSYIDVKNRLAAYQIEGI